jgi:hypothetical protein
MGGIAMSTIRLRVAGRMFPALEERATQLRITTTTEEELTMANDSIRLYTSLKTPNRPIGFEIEFEGWEDAAEFGGHLQEAYDLAERDDCEQQFYPLFVIDQVNREVGEIGREGLDEIARQAGEVLSRYRQDLSPGAILTLERLSRAKPRRLKPEESEDDGSEAQWDL